MRDQMRDHFIKYKLIQDSHHGFTKGRSYLINLLEMKQFLTGWISKVQWMLFILTFKKLLMRYH